MRKFSQPQNPNPTDLRVQRRHKKRAGKVERDTARVFYMRLSQVRLKIQFNRIVVVTTPHTDANSIQKDNHQLISKRQKGAPLSAPFSAYTKVDTSLLHKLVQRITPAHSCTPADSRRTNSSCGLSAEALVHFL